jgi:hypothetical protein
VWKTTSSERFSVAQITGQRPVVTVDRVNECDGKTLSKRNHLFWHLFARIETLFIGQAVLKFNIKNMSAVDGVLTQCDVACRLN